MMDNTQSGHDLPIPVYLNQQIVFDLFAIKDDGFSTIRTVKTTSSQETSEEKSIDGGIGVNNVFAFLGVQFGAKKAQASAQADGSAIEEEKIHTPNSLFAKLREILRSENTISTLNSKVDFNALEVGQFVEFDATLTKAPMITMLESFLEVMKLESFFDQPESSGSKSGKSGKSNKANPMVRKMEDLLQAITPKNAIQLIGSITSSQDIRAVLSAKEDFFIDKDVTEALDGEYRILGKITRLVKEGDEPINLLSRTTFTAFQASIFDQLTSSFENEGNSEFTRLLDLPNLEFGISAPAIQIYPIAIFR